jgi:D-3-phosphoglycerate dehydrogenase
MKEYDITYCELNTLMQDSDIISLHLSLSDKTQKLINKDRLALMKPEAILINTSRGEIIDENALYEALINSWIGGAGLDVFENEPYTGPLTKLDNVVLTPHIGAYAKEIRIKMEVEAAENLIRGLNEL